MFAIVLLGVFLLIAVLSVLGLTADSRDLRPHLPLQSGGTESGGPWPPEILARTALPPYHRARARTH